MKIRVAKQPFEIAGIILAMCCILVCVVGHEGADMIRSIGRTAVFGLLLFGIFLKGFPVCWEIAVFCGLSLCAAIVVAVYHTFGVSNYFNLSMSLSSAVEYCLFIYCGFFIAQRRWESGSLFRWIRFLSVAAGVIIIAQYLFYWMGIHLNDIPGVGQYIFHAVDTDVYFRPSAFFSEPSYVAEIVLLDLFSNLFRKRNMRMVVLNLLTLMLSTSALGIVLGYGLLVLWAITQKLVKTDILNFFIKSVLVALLIVLLVAFLGYSGDNVIINRILEGSTVIQRTYRAFEIYGRLEPIEQIIGIGMQNLSNYLNSHNIHLVNDGADTLVNREFAQTFGYVLCSLGVLGVGAYILHILSLFKRTAGKYYGLIFVFIGLSLTANLHTRLIFVLYIAAMWTVAFESKGEVVQKKQDPREIAAGDQQVQTGAPRVV